MRILTERLELLPGRPRDVPALYHALRRNVDHLRPYTPAPEPGEKRPSLTVAARELARWRSLWQRGDSYAFYVWPREANGGRDDRPIIGRITLGRVTRGVFQNAYLGYWIDRDHQSSGLMTEAVRAVLKFAFGPLRLHRVQAGVMPENERSMRVLEKNGFWREGLALRYLKIAGEWRDHVLFALTLEEWEKTI